MHLVFTALTAKIEQEVGEYFGVCILKLQVGLRKNEIKENETSSCSGMNKKFSNC